MISYTDALDGIDASQLQGFFEGWPDPPTPLTHLRLLQGSSEILLATDDEAARVVGFVTALSDGVLSAYLPLLEVLPAYRGRGIGTELLRRMLHKLDGLYMVDLMSDAHVRPFYERLGMRAATGMILRNHERQSGR